MPEPYAVVRFQMRAEIGDHIFNDVVQFAASFEINSIPEGAITVAVGRRVDNDQAATIHSALTDFHVQLPAKVYLRAIIVDADRADTSLQAFATPKGKLIFDGYAVGIGWQRGQDSANFTIHLVHWLSQLHYASAISASSHPSNPADWKYPAGFKAQGFSTEKDAGAKIGTETAWVPVIRLDDLTVADLQTDLWGRALLRWMLKVAQDDPIESRLTRKLDPTTRSKAVVDALNRLSPNPAGVPLRVDLTGADGTVVAAGLRLAILNESGGSWLNTTLWGKLVGEWSPAYWFAVVPRVSDGLIVPIAGGIQGTPWTTINATDYNFCDANAQLHQVLRAVGIVFPAVSSTGLDGMSGGAITNQTGCYGFFNPDGLTEGLVLMKDPPQWLCDPLVARAFTATSTNKICSGPIGTGLDKSGTGAGPKPRDPAATLQGHKDLMDRFAQQWYAIEMLKGRTGELSGKLRFDICPGSNVMIQAGTAKNIDANQDALVVDVFATVNRVSMAINAESSRAGTAFSIAHIRTAPENQSLLTSVPRPPLYLDAWQGAALVT